MYLIELAHTFMVTIYSIKLNWLSSLLIYWLLKGLNLLSWFKFIFLSFVGRIIKFTSQHFPKHVYIMKNIVKRFTNIFAIRNQEEEKTEK